MPSKSFLLSKEKTCGAAGPPMPAKWFPPHAKCKYAFLHRWNFEHLSKLNCLDIGHCIYIFPYFWEANCQFWDALTRYQWLMEKKCILNLGLKLKCSIWSSLWQLSLWQLAGNLSGFDLKTYWNRKKAPVSNLVDFVDITRSFKLSVARLRHETLQLLQELVWGVNFPFPFQHVAETTKILVNIFVRVARLEKI